MLFYLVVLEPVCLSSKPAWHILTCLLHDCDLRRELFTKRTFGAYKLTNSPAFLQSLLSQRLMLVPRLPALPVRPILHTEVKYHMQGCHQGLKNITESKITLKYR